VAQIPRADCISELKGRSADEQVGKGITRPLLLASASIFVAQAAGVHMPLGQQLLMMLTLMLTSKGVAAVPRASLVILAGTLATFGLPLSGVALILGADALMDMARTSVNLLGNCMASAVVARWEGVDLSVAEPKLGAAEVR
jgi:proton glutamate symport protein